MITTAVILAAGRGTRLGEVTKTRSKAMTPIAGEPMIGRVMREFTHAGIHRFVVVAAPHDSELKRFCAGIQGVSVVEQQRLLGSGDALRTCEGLVSGNFVVSACDSVVPAGDIQLLCARHEQGDVKATVAVLTVTGETPLGARSVVLVEGGRVVQLIEKPGSGERISDVTALPLYACSDAIYAELRALSPSVRGEYELPTVFSKLAARGETVLAVDISARRDLTNVQDLLDLNIVYLERLHPVVQIDSSALIAPGVEIVKPVLVGPGCVVQEGVTLGPYVYLEAQVTVGARSVVRRSVALRGAHVAGQVDGAVVCSGVQWCEQLE